MPVCRFLNNKSTQKCSLEEQEMCHRLLHGVISCSKGNKAVSTNLLICLTEQFKDALHYSFFYFFKEEESFFLNCLLNTK